MNIVDIRNKIDKHTNDHAFGVAAWILVDELIEVLEKMKLLPGIEAGNVTRNAYIRATGLADLYRERESCEHDVTLFEGAASLVEFVAYRLQRSREYENIPPGE